MRLGGSIESRHGVDEPDYEPASSRSRDTMDKPPPPDPPPRRDISPLGLGLVGAAAIAMVAGVFLPASEPTSTLATIEQNTLIQQEGWSFIAFEVLAVIPAYRSYRSGRDRGIPARCFGARHGSRRPPNAPVAAKRRSSHGSLPGLR